MLPLGEMAIDQLPAARLDLGFKDPLLPRFVVRQKWVDRDIYYLVKPAVMETELRAQVFNGD